MRHDWQQRVEEVRLSMERQQQLRCRGLDELVRQLLREVVMNSKLSTLLSVHVVHEVGGVQSHSGYEGTEGQACCALVRLART